jgi:phage terminase large subunit-like protein
MTTTSDLRLTDEQIAVMTDAELAEYEAILRAEAHRVGVRGWRSKAREAQLPPEGDWSILHLRGGRGSGKSWASARIFGELLLEADPLRVESGPGQWAIVAPTYGDARDVCVEAPESGLLAALGTDRNEVDSGRSERVALWNRSLGELRLRDGSVIFIDGADDGALRIQGKNLRGCWAEEIGLWKRWEQAWDESIGYALRKGDAKLVASGTPKADMPARALVQRLIADEKVVNRRLRTFDNEANLSPAFLESRRLQIGTRLGRQELEGEILEDVEGALWSRAWIDDTRVQGPPELRRSVVALDPADGTAAGDKQAIVTAGQGIDGHFYVLRSEGHKTTPLKWLQRAVRLARDLGANIVVEKNHGGAFLTGLLNTAMDDLGVWAPYRVVTASQGKTTRAEPVATLYEQGRVHHCGVHEDLEEQMVLWTGASGQRSPDELDALVWGLTELMGYGVGSDADALAVPWSEHAAGENGAIPYRNVFSTDIGQWARS